MLKTEGSGLRAYWAGQVYVVPDDQGKIFCAKGLAMEDKSLEPTENKAVVSAPELVGMPVCTDSKKRRRKCR